MGACGRCMLIGTLVLAVGVGMLFNVTIPKGFQDATKLRLFFGALKLFQPVVSVCTCMRAYVRLCMYFNDPGARGIGNMPI